MMNPFKLPVSDILQFLKELSANNNKEWFDAHREQYEKIKKANALFAEAQIANLSKLEPKLASLEPKNCVFRINRDVRFSKNKEPYKQNIGFSFTLGGKKSVYAGFYFHIQANNQSFMAGGLYMPSSDILKKVRADIDYRPQDFLAAIENPDFKKFFHQLSGEKTTQAPKGYSISHPQIEYLKHKSLLAWHTIADKDLEKIDLETYCSKVYKAMLPMNQFLNQAIDFEE